MNIILYTNTNTNTDTDAIWILDTDIELDTNTGYRKSIYPILFVNQLDS